MRQSSTALAVDGKVWLFDPLRMEGLEREIGALGEAAGIVSTIGWHDRDVDWFASLYGVPVYMARWLRNKLFNARAERVDGTVPGTPFRLIDTSMRGALSFWSESAVWWPEEALLVTGDCLGTASYFHLPEERLGVHPVVRLSPPRVLATLQPRRIFCGHGESTGDAGPGASALLDRALRTATVDRRKMWRYAITKGWRGIG
jgi:hypothetical protein